MLLIGVYTNLSTFTAFAKLLYNEMRDNIDARGFSLPAWKGFDYGLSAVMTLHMFDRLCHKLDFVTHYARRNDLSGSSAGGNAPCRESLITTVTMLGS